MKLISFVSFKGGAGKTTALIAIAAILVAEGHRVALIEADENAPLERGKANAKAIETRSDRSRAAIRSRKRSGRSTRPSAPAAPSRSPIPRAVAPR